MVHVAEHNTKMRVMGMCAAAVGVGRTAKSKNGGGQYMWWRHPTASTCELLSALECGHVRERPAAKLVVKRDVLLSEQPYHPLLTALGVATFQKPAANSIEACK